MNVDVLLSNHRLYIEEDLEDFASLFTSIAGFKKERAKERFLLKNWYEGYLFCLLIGLKTENRQTDGYNNKKEKANNFNTYVKQYKYAISLLLSKPDIINELNLKNRKSINQIEDLKTLLDSIKDICDQYAIGGLKHLKELYEKDEYLFEDVFALKSIYESQ